MKLEIPLSIKLSANLIYGGRHWMLRKKDADAYHKLIEEAVKKANIFPIAEFPVSIVIFFYFKNRPLDSSNCFYMAKLIEDSLITSGIIEDDSPEFVDYIGCASRTDKHNPRIEVNIEEI